MRGTPDPQLAMLSTLSTEDLIPQDHPIRRIRRVVDAVLADLDESFQAMYSTRGRRSVPPETLLKASVLMALYSIRSERAFCERLNYDLLFKWFLDLRIDEAAFDASTFSKNRQRLLDHEIADEFFAAVVAQARLRRYLSSEHFSVDGTLLEAWASHKSFKPKDDQSQRPGPPAGRNPDVGWHGQRRSNETHASSTDPEARLYRKSSNTAARLCYAGHLLMEHRNALLVDAELTPATGYAERDTALEMLGRLPASRRRRSVAGDKGYDTADFVARTRRLGFTPHVAPNTTNRRSAIDGRTTRHRATPSASGSANASRSPSVGSRPSPGAVSSATSARPATGPGSASPPPSTTSSASPPSTPKPPPEPPRRRPTGPPAGAEPTRPERPKPPVRHRSRPSPTTPKPNFSTLLEPVRPTVRNGRLDTDLLVTRTIEPLSTPARALAGLVSGLPQGADARIGIR